MDEALQTAYLKAYRAYDSFEGRSGFDTWLYTIVYRCCIDHRWQRTERQAIAPQSELALKADPRVRVENQAISRAVIARGLAALTPEHRAVLVLVDLEGFRLSEVAEILELPTGTIASRIARARSALRRAIESARKENRHEL